MNHFVDSVWRCGFLVFVASDKTDKPLPSFVTGRGRGLEAGSFVPAKRAAGNLGLAAGCRNGFGFATGDCCCRQTRIGFFPSLWDSPKAEFFCSAVSEWRGLEEKQE